MSTILSDTLTATQQPKKVSTFSFISDVGDVQGVHQLQRKNSYPSTNESDHISTKMYFSPHCGYTQLLGNTLDTSVF